jgi:hypothetical protein
VVPTARHIRSALRAGLLKAQPFPHLRFSNLLPEGTALGLADLALPRAPSGQARDKIFFSPDVQRQFPLCAAVASAFQNAETVFTLESLFDVSLQGTLLRIQYAREAVKTAREPHRGADGKKLNLHLYLSKDLPDDGMDLFDSPDRYVVTVPGLFNQGFAFLVGDKSWHGYGSRPGKGQRRSINISYVDAAWRARDELSFPNSPLG